MINNGGILEMNAGSGITDNTKSSGWQAGVYIHEEAKFTMNNGEISGIIALGGGSVWVEGTFNMNNNAKIFNNKSTENSGAGVWVLKNGIFTMNGGEISGNTAYIDGGGVQAYGGKFYMYGGKISGNTSLTGSGGGGVAVLDSGSIFNMSGGEISGNNKARYGGGVHVYLGSFTMSNNAIISGNTTTEKSGGGVNIDGYESSFKMEDGKIFGNESVSDGGGVCVAHGSFIMAGGSIYNNTAKFNGGGVRVWSGIFDKKNTGGTINNNIAKYGNAASADSESNNNSVKKRENNVPSDVGLSYNGITGEADGGWNSP